MPGEPPKPMLVAFSCPVCEEGQVGFRTHGESLFLLCSECGYVFPHPAKAEASDALDPLLPSFRRRYPDLELRASRWATKEEVEEKGWSVYLLKPTDLQ